MNKFKDKLEILKFEYSFVKNKIIEYFKLVRIPGWGAYSIPAVFGALTTGVFNINQIIILFIIGILATIFGFVLNDYADVSTDKLSVDLLERPLVKGTITKQNALLISIFASVTHYIVVIVAMIINIFLFSYIAIVVLTVAAIFTIIYNFWGKRIVGSDIFVAGGTALYCLFGALVVSEVIGGLTLIVVIVTFIQVFYLNSIVGGLKDVDHDYKLGGKNLAIFLGVKAEEKLHIPISFKILAVSLRSLSVIFIFIPFLYFSDFSYFFWQPIIIIVMFIGVFISTIRMIMMRIFDRNYLRKLISVQAFLRYQIVPVMLIYQIGIPLGLILIIFPFSWYALFNWFLYGKTIQPKTL
jgi:4-hydroxybenzoate polyprenyltransferase